MKKRILLLILIVAFVSLCTSHVSFASGSISDLVNEIISRSSIQVDKEYDDLPKNHWIYHDVMWMVSKGYVTDSNQSFKPNRLITKAEFASILGRMLDAKGKSSPFPDVKGHWAEERIAGLVELGIIDFCKQKDGFIAIEEIIEQAESLDVYVDHQEEETFEKTTDLGTPIGKVVLLENIPIYLENDGDLIEVMTREKNERFLVYEILEDLYHIGSNLYFKKNDNLLKYEENDCETMYGFNPDNSITRIEAVKMMAKALAYKKEDFKNTLNILRNLSRNDLPFVDYKEIREEDVPFVALIYGTNIISDFPGSHFGFNKGMSRAEAVKVLRQFYDTMMGHGDSEFNYLKEWIEVAETGTNATTVSNLVPALKKYEDRFNPDYHDLPEFQESFREGMIINSPKLKAEIKRVYVLPYNGDSLFKKKFMPDGRDYILENIHPNYWDESKHDGWVAAEIEIEFKDDITKKQLYETIYGLSVWWAYDGGMKMYGFEMPSTQDIHLKGKQETFVLYSFYSEKNGMVSLEIKDGDNKLHLFNSNAILDKKEKKSLWRLILEFFSWF